VDIDGLACPESNSFPARILSLYCRAGNDQQKQKLRHICNRLNSGGLYVDARPENAGPDACHGEYVYDMRGACGDCRHPGVPTIGRMG